MSVAYEQQEPRVAVRAPTPYRGHFRTVIVIGEIAVAVETRDAAFLRLLEERYAGFIEPVDDPDYEFVIDLTPPTDISADDDVRVYRAGSLWRIERGDFRAEWDPGKRRGYIRQSPNPYSIDAVLRIVHSLVLAGERGCLMHAASAVRNGKAFIFAGVSGAGKTTISRLAPPDAFLLTDEISYVRKEAAGYVGYGTPFAGELAKSGENLKAPLAGVYLLAQGPENRIDPISASEAVRGILANTLFFAEDAELVQTVFHSAHEFVEQVPVRRLTFMPDNRVWELIQ